MGHGEDGRKRSGLRLVFVAGAVIVAIPLFIEVFVASHWPLVHDAGVFQYLNFLMSKGFAPYRDIPDLSMPGALILENMAIHAFGGGATGWFIWDQIGVAIVVLSSGMIAGTSRRAIGFSAGVLACLFHLSDGAWFVGQRDWMICALLLLSVGCLFGFLRGRHERWMFGAAFCAAAAATIKPSAILFWLLVVATGFWKSRKYCHKVPAVLVAAIAGSAVPIVVVLLFLAKWHAIRDFENVLTCLIPYYKTLGRVSVMNLLWFQFGWIDRFLIVSTLGASFLFVMNRSWHCVRSVVLSLGVVCGVFSYVVQAKGWHYHLYPAITFAFLWIALEVEKSIRGRGLRACIAWPLLICLVIVLPSGLLIRQRRHLYPLGTMKNLQSDLDSWSGRDIEDRVQCLDETHTDCFSVLYRSRLVASTGFIHDFYLFPEQSFPVTVSLQNRFLEQVRSKPPAVIVLSEQVWPGGGVGYKQLARWPAFNSFLSEHYRLGKEYVADRSDLAGYRIYRLNSTRDGTLEPGLGRK